MGGRSINKLSAVAVSRATKAGYYGDGAGLYLQVGKSGSKSWLYRFMLHGRAREMGLGPLHTVSLAEARQRAKEARLLVLDGIDPIEHRKAEKAARRAEAASVVTFKEAAERYIKAHSPGWKNEKHAAQWSSTLANYAYPVIGKMSVADIDTGHIVKILEPIWTTKTETASRVRGRLESILDWATVRDYRKGENPARWRGHLQSLLPKREKVQKVKHHAALPYAELPAFMEALRAEEGISARGLEFTILTAARTSEVIGATWGEVDFDSAVWTVPADRIKAGREHKVPLSPRALEILEEMKSLAQSEYVFPGAREKKPLSQMAFLMTLRRMERTDITAHGFRSTFRDWVAETTAYPRDVAEMALAHAIGNKVEAAYRRGDLLAKRKRLMNDWARYCQSKPARGDVVPLKGAPL